MKQSIRKIWRSVRRFYLTKIVSPVIKSRKAFEKLSVKNDIPGLKDMWVCKFLITDINTDKPKLFFMETSKFYHHYPFYKLVTGNEISEEQFDSITYYSNDNRQVLAGSIVAHDNFVSDSQDKGIYTIEFWPTDPAAFKYVKLTWDMISIGLPFAGNKLFYHISSQLQSKQFISDTEQYKLSDIKTMDTDKLFMGMTFIPLNLGDSFGVLRFMDAEDVPDMLDIVIFRSLPNDLSHVRGIITDVSQTPLSHVNLKAKQNSIPNAYIKNASKMEEFLRLKDKPVRFTVKANGYEIRESSMEQIERHMKDKVPDKSVIPPVNLDEKEIRNLKHIGFSDSTSVGSKASNIGEVKKILEEKYTIEGFAIPFYCYDRFMKENDFYSEIEKLLAESGLSADVETNKVTVEKIQTLINSGKLPENIANKIREMVELFPADSDLRMRSSSNSEDLENFNGAGLYSSECYNHAVDDYKDVIKEVWAGLWTYRAYMEREFHKIDHSAIAMGILVHGDIKNERNNGVIVTKNIYDNTREGYYVNVQTGQSLVTNPEENTLPDELIVTFFEEQEQPEIQYIRKSNLTSGGKHVMSEERVLELVEQCRIIHTHFKKLYEAESDDTFAMEIEFLTSQEGQLKIMQARPWLD